MRAAARVLATGLAGPRPVVPPRRPRQPLSDEELVRKLHDNAVRTSPEERAAELAARTLTLPDAQSVEDLTALLTPAGNAEIETVTASGLRHRVPCRRPDFSIPSECSIPLRLLRKPHGR
jgi:hypothetical protein